MTIGHEELRQAIRSLLEATPDPPAADADPADVLAAAEALVEARQALVGALEQLLRGKPDLGGAESELIAQLRDRDARWMAALERARRELSERMVAARRMRERQRKDG